MQETRGVMFVFLEAASIRSARRFYEHDLALPVIENRFHPPHDYHGVVKYDAETAIVALNKALPPYDPEAQDDLTLVFATDPRSPLAPGEHEDGDHHAIRVVPGSGPSRLVEIELVVHSLDAANEFYGNQLALRRAAAAPGSLRFETPTVTLAFRAATTRRPRSSRRDGVLVVLYAPDVRRAVAALERRGLAFRGPAVDAEIGTSARFWDPDGHRLCLYQPSAEALRWESGPKVCELARRVGYPLVA